MENIMGSLTNKITEAHRDEMDKPFTRAEIDLALKNMNPSKTLGPDGAHTFFFYQKYWDILGEDVSRICLEVLNEGKKLTPISKTFLTLIPNTQSPKKMEDFRPISLCNVVYKIVAKTITNRLNEGS